MRTVTSLSPARLKGVVLVLLLLTACSLNGQTSGTIGIPTRIVYSDAWDRIHSQGKMIIGVDANRPPFARFNEDLALEGFDIAIMHEIGQQTGIAVEFRDFTPEGLEQAIQSGQIDAAIVSATEINTTSVRLSSTYYIGSDGVLALADSVMGSVRTAADIGAKRIGVLRDGSYQAWATEQVPTGQLMLLEHNEDAVSALKARQIDIAVIDLASAEALALTGELRIIGQDIHPLHMAVAMSTGSRMLGEQVNAALSGMRQAGRITQLATQYLQIKKEAIQQTPAPGMSTESRAVINPVIPDPGNCSNGMAFVGHLSLDDQNMTHIPDLHPGQAFTKTWRVRNSSACSWYLSYRLVYAYGNVPDARMNGRVALVDQEIKPGDTEDFQIGMVAPATPGTYRGAWQMIDGRSKPFGERLYVVIHVPSQSDIDNKTPAATDGKWKVGIDLNSPPFAFYNETSQMDGFSVAVMREAGRRMNMAVEFHDIPTEGLGHAIQAGQIDLAIAPTSSDITGAVSKTDIFYTGEGGMIAPSESQIAYGLSISGMMKLRIGVLSGTIFDYWLSRQSPAKQPVSYAQIYDLVLAVKQHNVDIGLLDLGVASELVSQGMRLVGQGVYPHNMVIAMPIDNDTLLPLLNTTLSQMRSDKNINLLAEQYLHLGRNEILPVLPIDSSQPESSQPASECINAMAVETSAGFDANTSNAITTAPGAPLTRNWRIRNTGTCVWSTYYRLAFAYGNTPKAQMGGLDNSLTKQVQPSQTVDMHLSLTSPAVHGFYRGVWQMVDATANPLANVYT